MSEITLYIGRDKSSKKEKFLDHISKLEGKVQGIITEKIGQDTNQPAKCYLHEYGKEYFYTEANTIGICLKRHADKIPSVFDREGVRILTSIEEDATIVIYEISTMENEAYLYQQALLKLMDQGCHDMVIAVRDKDTAFINSIVSHKNVTKIIKCEMEINNE